MRRFWWRRRAPRTRETWLIWAARFGYAACGTVYAIIGLVAIAAALGLSRRPAGSHGVLHFFADLPFGPLALAGLGVGLAGYAALNFSGALRDPERRGMDAWGLIERGIDILTGALYMAFAITALAMIVDPQHRLGATAAASLKRILEMRSGSVIMIAIGITLVMSGGYLFYRAAREPFGEMLDRRSLSSVARRAIALAARAGTAARGAIFIICGMTAIRAAKGSELGEVVDVGDALSTLGDVPFGPLLLAIVGAGFVAYGGYQLAKARYQRIAA